MFIRSSPALDALAHEKIFRNFLIESLKRKILAPLSFALFFVLIHMGVYWFIYTVLYCLVTIWWFSCLGSQAFHEKLRTTVRWHALVSFALNSMVIASLATLMLLT